MRQHEAINRIEYVSRDQALEQLKRSTGLADVIGGLTQNPLPDAFIIFPQKTDAQALETLRDELQKLPKVDKVQLDSAWHANWKRYSSSAGWRYCYSPHCLVLRWVAIIFNTIRLQILTQRDEIEVSKLIGATNAFIRRPFLYFGLLQGLPGWLGCMAHHQRQPEIT
ncbi:MAG: permease-like cell division protein FtsX [Nitrosomonadales bacterium]